jgi:hypothetical protein
MKYAVVAVFDQTILYWSSKNWTVDHENVKLYDSHDEAESVRLSCSGDFIEEVSDEEEFRLRPPTWGPASSYRRICAK